MACKPEVVIFSAMKGDWFTTWLCAIRSLICVMHIHRISNIQCQSNLMDVRFVTFYLPLCRSRSWPRSHHSLPAFSIIHFPQPAVKNSLLQATNQEAAGAALTDVRSFRPVSKLPVASKLLDRVVCRQTSCWSPQ